MTPRQRELRERWTIAKEEAEIAYRWALAIATDSMRAARVERNKKVREADAAYFAALDKMPRK